MSDHNESTFNVDVNHHGQGTNNFIGVQNLSVDNADLATFNVRYSLVFQIIRLITQSYYFILSEIF